MQVRKLLCLWAFWGLCAHPGQLRAQGVSFSQLSLSNGLSSNGVVALSIDKSGFLWAATKDGLNRYDGYSVKVYNTSNSSNLAANEAENLVCDPKNRLWISSNQGLNLLDEQRQMQRIRLTDSLSSFGCRAVMPTHARGNILFTSAGQFYYDEKRQLGLPLNWDVPGLTYKGFKDADAFAENQILYVSDSLVLLLDYATQTVLFRQSFRQPMSACRSGKNEIAVGLYTGQILFIDIQTGITRRHQQLTNTINGKLVNTTLREIRLASNNDLLIATGFSGLVALSPGGQVRRLLHDPINPQSIASNNIYRVICNANGDVIVATLSAGISVFNINNQQVSQRRIFFDSKGVFFDGYINQFAEDQSGDIWMTAQDRLIWWNRKTNLSTFFYYYFQLPGPGMQSTEIREPCFDRFGNLWMSVLGPGLARLNTSSWQIEAIPRKNNSSPATHSGLVLDILNTRSGNLWVSTVAGIYAINPKTLAVDALIDRKGLAPVVKQRVNVLLEDRKGRIWLGTWNNGLYCYDPQTDQLRQYSSEQGLVSTRCINLLEDKEGNIFAGSPKGFSIIDSTGYIQVFTKENGLRFDNCNAFVEDRDGKIWISNDKCLLRFDAEHGHFDYFDANAGLSSEGYRVNSGYRLSTGELVWGGPHGINYFEPAKLVNFPAQVQLSIWAVDIRDSMVMTQSLRPLDLTYSENDLVFHFTAINLKGSRNIQYRYLLDGFDKDWKEGIDIREARYPALTPGNYRFTVKASLDGDHWIESVNEIAFLIRPALWQRWWFISLCILLLTSLIALIAYSRHRKLKKLQDEREAEEAINYFANSLYKQQTEEEMLWDVARNCISRLHFEDCVIYLLDQKKQVLIQKAAHGPKSPADFQISQPLEIPVGKGIVGAVAATARPEIIADTRLDARYIMDDSQRLSEISVPIIGDMQVLGVIDCEHSKKAFFTQKHLTILVTIASLCANKIIKVRAEAEKRRAEKNLMDTRQKMTEVEMQALRAQMNPHFIFNCLNSINRYIVKSDQATASLYLTRFAKLIRLILDNSNSKNVILSNELEALKLYIEMEALRFDKKFIYHITVDDNLNIDSVELPPLIIQPYVENAIWHGLLHRDQDGMLDIHLRLIKENILECIIEDNGVGRARARELRSKSATSRKSLGMKLTEDRLQLLNKHAELNAGIDILDLQHPDGTPAGTRVILTIPI